ARKSDAQTAEWEARMSPAYLVEYNELVIPFIAGDDLDLTLYYDDGSYAYRAIGATTVKRFAVPRRYNGRMTLRTRSRTRLDTQYIHVAAAPEIRTSQWIDEGYAEATRDLEASGTLTVTAVYLYPGRVPVAAEIYVDDVGPESGAVAVTAG